MPGPRHGGEFGPFDLRGQRIGAHRLGHGLDLTQIEDPHPGQNVIRPALGHRLRQRRIDGQNMADAPVQARGLISLLFDRGEIHTRRLHPATVHKARVAVAIVDEPLFRDPLARQRQHRMPAKRKAKRADAGHVGGQPLGAGGDPVQKQAQVQGTFPDAHGLEGIAVARPGAGMVGGHDDHALPRQFPRDPAQLQSIAARAMRQDHNGMPAVPGRRPAPHVMAIEQRVLPDQLLCAVLLRRIPDGHIQGHVAMRRGHLGLCQARQHVRRGQVLGLQQGHGPEQNNNGQNGRNGQTDHPFHEISPLENLRRDYSKV